MSEPKDLAEVVAKLQSMLRVGSANGWITAPVMLRDVRTLVAFADEWVAVVAERERLRGELEVAQGFHGVAVAERNLAHHQLTELERENAALREPKP